jgi:hypothetical protein
MGKTVIEIRADSQEKNGCKDEDLVCHCFVYTYRDIVKDYVDNNGRSTILERIEFEKKAGKCDCAMKNPQGR